MHINLTGNIKSGPSKCCWIQNIFTLPTAAVACTSRH